MLNLCLGNSCKTPAGPPYSNGFRPRTPRFEILRDLQNRPSRRILRCMGILCPASRIRHDPAVFRYPERCGLEHPCGVAPGTITSIAGPICSFCAAYRLLITQRELEDLVCSKSPVDRREGPPRIGSPGQLVLQSQEIRFREGAGTDHRQPHLTCINSHH